MKNLSLLLNVVLLVAVIVLFYLHFSSHKTGDAVVTEGNDSAAVTPGLPLTNKVLKEGRIYFVNLDTLNARYQMVLDITKKLNDKKAGIEAQYQSKGQKYQEDLMNYQKRLNENTITVDEARQVETSLKKQQDALVALENSMDNLSNDLDKGQLELQKKLDEFMAEYTRGKKIDYILSSSSFVRTILYGNDSLDITSEVVNGLNERYKQQNIKK